MFMYADLSLELKTIINENAYMTIAIRKLL